MMDYLKLTPDKLSVEEISDMVADDGCGAIALFVGTTRDNFEGRKVVCLEYEAYEAMALKSLKSICEDTRNRWSNVYNIAVHHRLGIVPIKEASVVIAVSSPHRRDALEAVSYCIDQLKASVPIWKKEKYEGSGAVWKENKECVTGKKERALDESLVQINVSTDEIKKRIQNFIETKREQVNVHNVQEFIYSPMAVGGGGGGDEDSETCARVRTQVVRRNDSKGHLKVRKVENEWGPQTMKTDLRQAKVGIANLPLAVSERVQDMERSLNMRPVATDVYVRLKAVEDKVTSLQAVSPEYAQFWNFKKLKTDVKQENLVEFTFSADDINKKIEQMERYGA